MSTTTQFNPNQGLNASLLRAGASKTVYALVTPETEAVKASVFGDAGSADREAYLDQFRDAWTGKQDAYHEEFFSTWLLWSSRVVDLPKDEFPFYYPTAGASEPIRQIIFDLAARSPKSSVHFFEGEYEGYKAMAEAAGLRVVQHVRSIADIRLYGAEIPSGDLFFISQPSAIDGNVWNDFNEFVDLMPSNSVIADVTYVGAVPQSAIETRFNLGATSIRNVVFSLSKPFGAYYDRIGGVFCRTEDLGLFGNRWFKSLTAIRIGTKLMEAHGVFDYPDLYGKDQRRMVSQINRVFGEQFVPSDVYILANAPLGSTDLSNYLRRGGTQRICLTPGMSILARAIDIPCSKFEPSDYAGLPYRTRGA